MATPSARAEKLQHRRRQKGNAQHAHGAGAQVFGMVTQSLARQLHGMQSTQRAQAAQAVQQESVHMAQLQHLLFASRLGTPAHDRHEERYQRRGNHQN
jgi:hypothetical protein